MALWDALLRLRQDGKLSTWPVRDYVAAVSIGVVDGESRLDLPYREDSVAEVDLNLAMTGGGLIVELQATAETEPFGRERLTEMLTLGEEGVRQLVAKQREVLGGDV